MSTRPSCERVALTRLTDSQHYMSSLGDTGTSKHVRSLRLVLAGRQADFDPHLFPVVLMISEFTWPYHAHPVELISSLYLTGRLPSVAMRLNPDMPIWSGYGGIHTSGSAPWRSISRQTLGIQMVRLIASWHAISLLAHATAALSYNHKHREFFFSNPPNALTPFFEIESSFRPPRVLPSRRLAPRSQPVPAGHFSLGDRAA
jgi:hypothetical protein